MGKKTKTDPTGQVKTRRRASRRLQRRLNLAQTAIKRLFREIPRTRRQKTILTNQVIPVYDYQITASEFEELERRITSTLGDQLLETANFNRMSPNWWWLVVVERPYREGTAEEIVEFNRQITRELVRIRAERGLVTQRLEIGDVLQSQIYLNALSNVQVSNFSVIRSLTETTANQVIQAIQLGISAGQPPSEIAKSITSRFDVAKSRAERIARTEINKAYNDAKLNATVIAAEQTGLRAGVLHLSALSTTTRATHADRHGNAYTVDQQRQWWNTGSNRINCQCSTRSVLIDRQGNVIDVELQEEIQAERAFFDEEMG